MKQLIQQQSQQLQRRPKNNSLDQVILVNESDHQLGVMDKVSAHRHPARLHRASSVLLYNSQGEWLIQQRSAYKIVGANQWANACCGNLRPGENYKQCAVRRLKEELDIAGVWLKRLHKFIYKIECNDEFGEHEMDTVFVGQYEGLVNPNPLEVKNIRWISTKELLEELDQNKSVYAPWTKLVLLTHPDFIKE
ncbi:isopentenyl-diphosphate Delta-isomerase [Patescibacteria group bacterium]|nr:isopentenyl-diphosphate Delta-isomerase [Patescibacteria group bacterium]